MRPLINIKSQKFNITDSLIGSGSFSCVKVAYQKNDRTAIALKIIHVSNEDEWLQSLNEISLLSLLNHPCIIKMVDYEITKFHVLIGLELGQFSLKEFIEKNNLTDLRRYAICVLEQLINALNYLKDCNLVHSDVKPDNIICMKEGNQLNIKLMDFGLSHVNGVKDDLKIVNIGGTKTYLAPERILSECYNENADLFSAGIVFFQMIYKIHPFLKSHENYKNTLSKHPTPLYPKDWQQGVNTQAIDLLNILLDYNSEKRTKARNHEVIKSSLVASIIDPLHLLLNCIETALKKENEQNYSELMVNYIKAIICIGMCQNDLSKKEQCQEISNGVSYKTKVLQTITIFKNSYTNFITDQSNGGTIIYDEFYEYLMDVTKSTPTLKHYLEIGYLGELYLKENKHHLAYENFISALKYLNRAMSKEPPSDRKSIIGKKMLHWTDIAETLKS